MALCLCPRKEGIIISSFDPKTLWKKHNVSFLFLCCARAARSRVVRSSHHTLFMKLMYGSLINNAWSSLDSTTHCSQFRSESINWLVSGKKLLLRLWKTSPYAWSLLILDAWAPACCGWASTGRLIITIDWCCISRCVVCHYWFCGGHVAWGSARGAAATAALSICSHRKICLVSNNG